VFGNVFNSRSLPEKESERTVWTASRARNPFGPNDNVSSRTITPTNCTATAIGCPFATVASRTAMPALAPVVASLTEQVPPSGVLLFLFK
jgi:hypothetical protein